MDKAEVISRLVKQNMELSDQVKDFTKICQNIHSRIYSIGAPLNDNILKYTNKQLTIFTRIAEDIKSVISKRR